MNIVISYFSNLLIYSKDKLDWNKYIQTENFELLFYEKSDEKITKQLKTKLGAKKFKELKEELLPLEKTLKQQWKKENSNLLIWKKYFKENINLFKKIVKDIETLVGVEKIKITKIPVYLIRDHKHKDKNIEAWFSWTPRKSFIAIEIPSNLKPSNDLFYLLIVIHEFFHLFLRKNKKLMKMINGIALENKSSLSMIDNHIPEKIILEELLISSFIPEGILKEIYTEEEIKNTKRKPKNFSSLRKFVGYKMKTRAQEYLIEKKKIDKEYLLEIIKNI